MNFCKIFRLLSFVLKVLGIFRQVWAFKAFLNLGLESSISRKIRSFFRVEFFFLKFSKRLLHLLTVAFMRVLNGWSIKLSQY